MPGPPKRFAQAIGATFTIALALFALVGHDHTVADVLLVGMIVASGLESIFAVCVGCELFALLMRTGLIPESVCLECADIGLRRASALELSAATAQAGRRAGGGARRWIQTNQISPASVNAEAT